MLNCDELSANGGEPSRDSVLPSLPLVCSKKIPYPPRMAILPSPLGSKAKPKRGAGLKRWPFKQPSCEFEAALALGNPSTGNVTPGPPHWTMPLKGLPEPGTSEPANVVTEPSASMVGALPVLNAAGSKLKACLYRSR